MAAKREIYEEITQTIIKAIEEGAGDFKMPWHSEGMRPVNSLTQASYRGINVLQLMISQSRSVFNSGYWATFKQWQELGAKVKKGEKGTPIIFYKTLIAEAKEARQSDQPDKPEQSTTNTKEANEDAGIAPEETNLKKIPMLKTSYVFNVNQIEGWNPPAIQLRDKTHVLASAESFVGHTGADIRHGGARAFYSLSDDFIQMPHREYFIGSPTSSETEAYYSTLLHELTHWTGHSKRCNRDLKNRFGSETYAMEELVAELGASFLCMDLEVSLSIRKDHAQYVQSWLKVLREDETAIFVASHRAMKAVEFLHGLQQVKAMESQATSLSKAHNSLNQATSLIAEMSAQNETSYEEENILYVMAKNHVQGRLF
jgi:antirestriction protein ArdC